jgi:hypothetical protein
VHGGRVLFPASTAFDFEDFRFVASLAGHRTHFEGELAPFASWL